jgi:hypothetical protein
VLRSPATNLNCAPCREDTEPFPLGAVFLHLWSLFHFDGLFSWQFMLQFLHLSLNGLLSSSASSASA